MAIALKPLAGRGLRLVAALEPASVALLYALLLWNSWRLWPDPLVDYPRELYTAWRLSEGDLLYRDIACWYGPLSLLVEAAAFRIFGTGFDTLVWLNVALTGGILLLIRGILWEMGNRLMVWLGSVVFLVVFATGQFMLVSNYNFITPYSSQAVYSFAGLLLVLWALLRNLRTGQTGQLWLAGIGLAVAYLDKPEPLLAALGALAVFIGVRWLRACRVDGPVAAWLMLAREGARVFAGFAAVWLAVFAVMTLWGGAAYAWGTVNRVPETLRPDGMGGAWASADIIKRAFGFDVPWENLAMHLRASGVLMMAAGLLIVAGAIVARAWPVRAARLRALVTLFVAAGVASWLLCLATARAGVEADAPVRGSFTWFSMGQQVILPTVLAAVGAVAMALAAAWAGRPANARAERLAIVGVAAALMLARMILNGTLTHYGFFLEPLAVFFVLHLLVVEAPRHFARGHEAPLAAAFALITLCGVVQLGIVSAAFYASKTQPIGEGRDRFYAYPPDLLMNGLLLDAMTAAVREHAPSARTLVAFPESFALNYSLRLPNSTAHFNFLPTDLAYAGRQRVLADLQASPPDVVVVYARDLHEFGVPYFGADAASGREILDWISQNYQLIHGVAFPHGPIPFSHNGHMFDVLVRRPAAPDVAAARP